MKQSVKRVLERGALALAAFVNLGGSGWAELTPPPVPSVPAGGIGSAVATCVLIVGYGIWKSRR